jgi:hypothetical protein
MELPISYPLMAVVGSGANQRVVRGQKKDTTGVSPKPDNENE